MPIYEYTCKACGHEFEQLIRGDQEAACPSCGKVRLDKRFSVPAAHTPGSSGSACPAKGSGACDISGCCGQGCDFGNPT
ncbi:MAG: zinc ribbon domain-containing protein [Pirellulales bacterium]|nr:zinc ribbon domain-containing protein [Pirellulales bacterium]